jgi:hypothetical protein
LDTFTPQNRRSRHDGGCPETKDYQQRPVPQNNIQRTTDMRYTQTTLKKLEEVFGELDYAVRYEKGNFQSGYCIVENRRIVVVNKFFDTEARINCLLDILSNIVVEPEKLSEASRELIQKSRKA